MLEGVRGEVISLLKYTWPTVVMAVIIAVLLRTTDLIVNKKKLVLHDELLSLVFVVYILCLFYVVTFQDVAWSSHNFLPFREILRYDFGTGLFYKNIFGNMLLFLPYGIFIAKYINLKSPTVLLIIAFITSLSVEVIQFLIGRVFDVDDIILNVLGCFIGFIAYKLFKKWGEKLPSFFKTNIFWDIVSIIILGGFLWFLIH